RLPAQCGMIEELCELPKINWRPPFFGPRRTLLFYWARLTKGDIHPEDHEWGTFGPALITYLTKKHGVAKLAQERSVCCPIRYHEDDIFDGPPASVESKLTPLTRAVHLWHSRLAGPAKSSPPPGSYLEAACRRHGI